MTFSGGLNGDDFFPSDDELDLAEDDLPCGGLGFGFDGDEFLCERDPVRDDDFFDDDDGDYFEGDERDCRE